MGPKDTHDPWPVSGLAPGMSDTSWNQTNTSLDSEVSLCGLDRSKEREREQLCGVWDGMTINHLVLQHVIIVYDI